MLRKFPIIASRSNNGLYKFQTLYSSQYGAATTNASKHKFELQPIHIQEVVKLQPKLASISPDLWQRTHETFINHGLETPRFLQVVCGNPALLTRPTQKIVNSFEIWRGCQFGEKLLHLMLVKYPEFFDVSNERQLLTHIGFLRSLVGTSKNVWKLIMNSPDLIEQSEHKIGEKFDYINERMRIEVPEIVKSAALSKPLDTISCRHIFLERLALFKPRSLKADPNVPSKNHRLYQICDTSDKTFATKVCHVRLEEYEAFQELFKSEQARKQENDEDSDLSSEDED